MALGDDLLSLGGFSDGGTVYGSGAGGKGGAGSSVDWNRISQLLSNAGTAAGHTTASDAAYDKRGGEGPGPSQSAGQGLSNLLATLIQMHRSAALAQSTPPPLAPRASLLG